MVQTVEVMVDWFLADRDHLQLSIWFISVVRFSIAVCVSVGSPFVNVCFNFACANDAIHRYICMLAFLFDVLCFAFSLR